MSFFNFHRNKMFHNIKSISKSNADKIVACADDIDNIESLILELNGKFYDCSEAEPLDIAEFIQLERFKKLGNK